MTAVANGISQSSSTVKVKSKKVKQQRTKLPVQRFRRGTQSPTIGRYQIGLIIKVINVQLKRDRLILLATF